MAVDTLLFNLGARGVDGGIVELIGIQQGKIAVVGRKDALNDLRGRRTRLVDCQGGFVVPGFNDAHCHPLAYAATLRQVDCSQVASIGHLQAELRRRAAGLSVDRWVRAANYEVAALAEGRPPTRWELDAAIADRPLVLLERSGQHCVLNSRALQECGIRDERSPNGLVPGSDAEAAARIPPPDSADFEAGVRKANSEYLSVGVTSIQDTSWSNGYRHWLAMQNLKARNLLQPRVTLHPGIDALAEFANRGLKTGSGDGGLRVGAAKIALDESSGTPIPSQAALDRAAMTAHRAGYQLAFHASDIPLLGMSLKAIEHVRASSAAPPIRPRLEHCPVCPPPFWPAIAACGAIVVAQPSLMFLAEGGAVPAGSFFPLRSLLEHGVAMAFSSDSPLTPCNPFQGIGAAVWRSKALPDADQAVPVAEALRRYSHGGAYCCREEDVKGALRTGLWADLAVLDGDPSDIPPEQLPAVRVAMTLIAGEVVWQH